MCRFWMEKASVQLEFRRLNSSRLLSGFENVPAHRRYVWNPGVSARKQSRWLWRRFSQTFFPMWSSTKAWPVWIMRCRFRSRFKMRQSCSVSTCTKSSTWISSQRWPFLPLANPLPSWLPVAGLLICWTLAIPSSPDSSRSRKVPLNPSKDSAIASLERDIPGLMEQATLPGLSAAVVRNGQTYWLYGFGVMNATSSEAVTPDTVFEAASLSKPVFAYGVLKLVEQGKLSLDTYVVPF